MLDHLMGRPSPSWKRIQVFLVILFWISRIVVGNPSAPRILYLRRINRVLARFTPWQLILSTLTALYTLRHFDQILPGLASPEPLAHLYSPSYYRATWIATALDAGFATAMAIRPKFLKDLCSILFSAYYILYAHEADEKLRRFRAVPTVEMFRATWEKTSNPYIRFFTSLPKVSIRRKILLPRPKGSSYQRPISAYIFFAPPENELAKATDLLLDFPGGGFVAMSPEHHEERLRAWARRTGKPVLALDYAKAPEYPYPFAMDEAFDTYRVLVESAGTLLGMSGKTFNVIMSGDSAGATLAVGVMLKIIEHNASKAKTPKPVIPSPVALVLNYAALDFNFTSWMTPEKIRVLQAEQSKSAAARTLRTDHLKNVSPLSMVRSGNNKRRPLRRRTLSWKDTIKGIAGTTDGSDETVPTRRATTGQDTIEHSTSGSGGSASSVHTLKARRAKTLGDELDRSESSESSDEVDTDAFKNIPEENRPIRARVRHFYPALPKPIAPPVIASPSVLEKQQPELYEAVKAADSQVAGGKAKAKDAEPTGTRLTMTSRTGYFQDRIISPSMMRAMAILYIGPHRNPDFATDYYISPILAPAHLLAQFPPLLMQCGEKDPFVDDTVIFAGRVREAKRARRDELDALLQHKNPRVGEGLRMSAAEPPPGSSEALRLAILRKERLQLAKETEEDWVHMVLFAEWSHGYMQMNMLMSEVQGVIDDIADWMDDAFVKLGNHPALPSPPPNAMPGASTRLQVPPSRNVRIVTPGTSETETDDPALSFVPRKYRTPPTSFSKDARPDFSPPIDSTSSDTLRGPDANETIRISSNPPSSDSEEHGTGGKGRGHTKPSGQTITEEELMKRRRMLDAHIFD